MSISVFPNRWTFGLSATVDRPRKRVHIVLPFLSILIEGEREWPPGAEPNLVGTHMNANEFCLAVEGGACAAIAASFAAELDRVGAENYVVVDFDTLNHGPISVTVQRKNGKRPCDVAAELRRELAALKAAA